MLHLFSVELKKKLNEVPDARPFVCDGNPLDCEVFIVGINPATAMKEKFLNFWSDKEGFNKEKWLECYDSERRQKQTEQNFKINRRSSTRERLNRFSSAMHPRKCLETNLYIKPTGKPSELKAEDKDTTFFQFLVKTIKPKVLFIHGVKVQREIERIFSIQLPKNEFMKVQIFDLQVIVISKKHLSRGWSFDCVNEFANSLKAQLKN